MSKKNKQVEEDKKGEYADYPNILRYSLKYALLHCGIPTFLFALLYMFTDISIFGKLFIIFMVAANCFLLLWFCGDFIYEIQKSRKKRVQRK